ncbi:hypothetical protein M2128_001230 [Polynucleobacter sphagniphilus]|uniref:cytochrome b n=1 Tax=Polynucleobacter sphagniphilus TaxID=1743169 RepID=UPI0024758845|nr:cytochrome b/b6 domain-containing protein [Polynucleobacter sphagniphilus]MDH6302309.1 hypothetical protein [Polynucleobacter sphagniphilus]
MSTVRYNPISVAFHWLMAAIIVVTWSIAIVVSDMPLSPARITGYSWHKWLGVTVFFFGDTAPSLAGNAPCTSTRNKNASLARAGDAINPFCPLFIDDGNTPSWMADELC